MSCGVGEVMERLLHLEVLLRACDVGKREKVWRMSCDVGEAMEGLENEL